MIAARDRITVIVLMILLALAAPASATEQYARETGLACASCHVDPSGGGPLTAKGIVFLSERSGGHGHTLSPGQRVVHFLIGYLHLLTAIAWFGTILYVHILLKPAYAAGGLPKGELLLGWISIVVISLTGTLLSIARLPSFGALFSTRFGILLSIKIGLFLIMASTAAVVTFVIGPKMRAKRLSAACEESGDLTLAMLAHYDGREGRPAYVAHRGTVYDVTASRMWKDGNHMRKHPAGMDLTEALGLAPHGEDKLAKFTAVCRLRSEAGPPSAPPHIRVFYFFAYMNLVFVFLIVFVIALMRWG